MSVGGSTPLVQTSSTSLKIRQTGDTYGETGLILENRTGTNGAIFYNSSPTASLVNFQFQNQSANNFSLRTEEQRPAFR